MGSFACRAWYRIWAAGSIALAIATAPLTNPALIASSAYAAPQDALVSEFARRERLFNAQRYDEVVKQADEFLGQMRARFGEDSEAFQNARKMIISSYSSLGRHAETLPLIEQHAAWLKAKGTDDEVWTLYTLGRTYLGLNRYLDAESPLTRLLGIFEKTLSPDDYRIRSTLRFLGIVYSRTDRFDEARSMFERELAYAEKALGPNHFNISKILYYVATQYTYGSVEVEPLLKRALAILEADKPSVSRGSGLCLVLDFLGTYYETRGRYAEAEAAYKRAVATGEKETPKDPHNAVILSNLADLYRVIGRSVDAVPLAQRALALFEKLAGAEASDTAGLAGRLAELYVEMSRYDEAESLYRRALAVTAKERAAATRDEQRKGADYNAATLSVGLAAIYRHQGRFAEAIPLLQQALTTREKERGADFTVVETLADLGNVYRQLGRMGEAASLYQRAVVMSERALAPDHPAAARVLDGRAVFLAATGDLKGALASSRQAVSIASKLLGRSTGAGSAFELAPLRQYFDSNLDILHQAAAQKVAGADAAPEAFEVAQWANQSAAATALGQLAARLASGSDGLAQLVRAQQDAAAEQRGLDKTLLEELAKPAEQRGVREQSLRKRMADLARRSGELNARIAAEFPDYAELARGKPLNVADTQKLLGADEALVFLLPGNKDSHVFALTRDGFVWKTIALGGDALTQKVAAFRRGLEVEAVDRVRDKIAPAQADKLFDLKLAHELYGALLGPVEALIKDKAHLLIVPSGALTALPFHLLVTESPAAAVPGELAGYRDAAWLIKRQAVSVLPSVASLKTLRGFARKEGAGKPLVGFGDPMFDPKEPKPVAGKGAQKVANRGAANVRGYAGFWQGAGIDRAQLTQLPRLPETADELKAVAQQLGAAPTDIHLRADASESTVKRLPLADYRVVYFATHGLVAGDVQGLAEPSLALSQPARPSADDGLLTASEVAQLKLNADWVVLSACNTIAGDKPGAEALSGLARAFFYAGARALLVSHWAVDSSAATALTTSTFDIIKREPPRGRAEALRRAMLAYMNDGADPRQAYPALWAPFVVVGEGAAR
jgi:CHAT domain-containing protein